ncbi:MAG TPA: tetratricopeptide repeat protein [Candidatus Obscuribacterales bacterium]
MGNPIVRLSKDIDIVDPETPGGAMTSPGGAMTTPTNAITPSFESAQLKQSSATIIADKQNDAIKKIEIQSRTIAPAINSRQMVVSQTGSGQFVAAETQLTSARKDVWDKIGAVAPIISGALIFLAGGYFTYSYNQQQLKVQEIQTIEKFIPHLTGSEQSKKAAILAISSLTDAELAGKIAALFASKGTVSALQSISESGNAKDRLVAEQAMAKVLENLSQRESRLNDIENAYKRAIENHSKSRFDEVDTPTSLNNLADGYRESGQLQLADQLLKRSLALLESNSGSDSVEASQTLKKLSEVAQLRGERVQAEQYMKRARAVDAKHNVQETAADVQHNQPGTESDGAANSHSALPPDTEPMRTSN